MIVPSKLKDTLKASKKASKKAHEVMFLISKGIYIMKVYSIHCILRENTNVKRFPSDKISGTKNALFFLSRTPTHHSFISN